MKDEQKDIIFEHMDKLHEYRCMLDYLSTAGSCVFENSTGYCDDIIYGMYEVHKLVLDAMKDSIAAIEAVLRPPAPV